MKADGLALHPIRITRKGFGYADYPECSFRIDFPPEAHAFRDGAAIECFYAGEEPVKGILLQWEGRTGEFRLFAPDFPDWIEENGVGIKLAPDTRTTGIMKKALQELEKYPRLHQWFQRMHEQGSTQPEKNPLSKSTIAGKLPTVSPHLNSSQRQAAEAILQNDNLLLVHGPPGTGKTTTLVEAVRLLVQGGARVLVAAPSNAAVDHFARELVKQQVKILRVGNTGKVDEAILPHTLEGKLSDPKVQKELKQLRKRADEFRRMALKYKRNFGKAEREQRQLLFKEVKKIREEIRRLQAYHEERSMSEASVILGTPVGLYDAGIQQIHFKTLILDEAGQCLEPLAWSILPLAGSWVLAGDHWQLPPTVLSEEAARLGFNRSILERAMGCADSVHLLDTQYRMRESIAGFSSQYFYKGMLRSHADLQNTGTHLHFIDTAGSGMEEEQGADGSSLVNKGELETLQKIMEQHALDPGDCALISPYSAQVALARETFPAKMRVSTIDSFQGQEKTIILLSLVRSNDQGIIGFLKDYRRMNVAITRAKEKLYVVGDSATIGQDPFFNQFLSYVEQKGSYGTVWELY